MVANKYGWSHVTRERDLRFDKGFNNLRERTSPFRHFYLAWGAQRMLGTFNQHLGSVLELVITFEIYGRMNKMT